MKKSTCINLFNKVSLLIRIIIIIIMNFFIFWKVPTVFACLKLCSLEGMCIQTLGGGKWYGIGITTTAKLGLLNSVFYDT